MIRPTSPARPLLAALVLLLLALPLTLAARTSAQPPAPDPAAEPASPPAEEKAADDAEEWSVEAPTGEPFEIPIRTDEGTWMSLDVSPDGREIVFDLLGDLYLLPIDGGRARSLTHGVAWDMQPRFSPDGTRIVFTSDRAGGDNLWTVGRDGSDPRQVTEESFRLLSSPAWTPDGLFVAGRKHFTSRRSLGAGEIWLYHVDGGEGLQMVARANDQKDLGEPAFSPDGRYLYFSQDTTPGGVFQYNKDPNGQIYQIRRLDRESGEIEDFVGGPGGAVRPTPSPDGHFLAFVRRVRARSVLFVKDLQTGDEWPLFDGLDRDMQEIWAVHGVYPTFAWTPDSRSLVFWAEGRIQRLDVAAGVVGEIGFTVDDTRTAFRAVRSTRPAAPDDFQVRMLRWVAVSPQGDRVVYQALGQLWVRELPDGTPRRLTAQDEHFEHEPAFSRDGRWIVYTTWHDRLLGSVRVVSADGGEGRIVTPEPGHYVEPTWSPDGSTIVYRKTAGGYLISPTWSSEPGLYAVASAGGEPRRVSRRGERPQFGAGSDRVYFLTFGEDQERRLESVELDGGEARTHFRSDNAQEFRVSPDERWIAFRERFHAFIAPFPRTGQTIDLGPKMKSLPVAKVTADAGEYLQWSGDSRTLYWALGPDLYHRDVEAAFAEEEEESGETAETAAEAMPEPASEPSAGAVRIVSVEPIEEEPAADDAIDISFRQPADKPSGTLALVGARVVTMRGDEVIEDGVVVVEDNRIRVVGARATTPVPAGATVIDVAGHTIVPGLIDVHAHGAQGQDGIVPQQNWSLYAGLAFGVTTIHDPSNDTATIFAASEMQRAGRIVGPRIFSTGTILYGAAGSFKAEIDSLDDARSHLRRMQAAGAFSVKSYNQPRREQRQQVLAAARELGMLVVPEGGALFQHNMTMVVDGHTGVEHSLSPARVYDDVLQLWSATEVAYTPTLIVAYGGLFGENYWYQHTNVWANERLLTFVPRRIVDERARRPTMAPEEEYNHIRTAEVCHALADAGVAVNVGAHGQREGLGAHWEMWMLVQGGMTPHQALRSATLNGATYLGMEADLGSIEAGKLADLLVLEKDPLTDIRSSESIRYTMVNGRLYDARTMDEIGLSPRPREPFYWELPPNSTGR